MKFSDLPDGAYFILAGVYTSMRVFQKVLEDGEHNCVWADATNRCELIPADMPVAEVSKPH